ncbi:hypothetical protein BSKO_10810 [Bryopsis sp. KO-2023]|nr:hypothetical protein BSKO_10810 [Bryopsis sp. KO-2023]
MSGTADERGGDAPRRFSGQVVKGQAPRSAIQHQIPESILTDEDLREAMSVLPDNYGFEIHKTIWRIRQKGAKTVALQFPEGLLMYSCIIADILERFGGAEHCFVLGDVTYGACCVDDFSAKALEADLLVHYGHSCLVPVDVTDVPCLYVFVTIDFDVKHLVGTVESHFEEGSNIALAGTIQFAKAVQACKVELAGRFPSLTVPQSRPLSQGEVLGCTAPLVKDGTSAIVFVADGRFHLEAIMIANPAIPAYRYDPYSKKMFLEEYDHAGMQRQRKNAVLTASGASRWGVILGALGRQGNPAILSTITRLLKDKEKSITKFVMSEIMPPRLTKIKNIDAWVQIACPRLSIDWGDEFKKPTLTPYETMVALGAVKPWWEDLETAETIAPAYPMDYYAKDGGQWNSSYHKKKKKPTSSPLIRKK